MNGASQSEHGIGNERIHHERTKTRKHTSRRSENDTFDDEGWGVEIQQQADMKAGGFQVRLQLGEVNGRQSGYSLKLKDDLRPNHQIETMQADIHALEENMDFLLALDRNGSMLQSDLPGLLINWLHEARPERLVEFDGGGQDFAR
jgi:hypothetical protein